MIEAAARLFHEQGYDRTSVRQLAEAVGILSGSVFHHFDSKEDILMAVMSNTIAAMTDQLDRAWAKPGSTREQLTRLIQTELELLHGKTRHGVAVAFFQWHSLSQANQREVLKMRSAYEAKWLATLEKARHEALIETDPFITRRLLTGANGWTIYWYRPDGSMDLNQLAAEVSRMLFGAASRDEP